MARSPRLAIVESHPVQYHAPVYRELQSGLGIDLSVIYGSNFSVAGYSDQEFARTFSWDVDLLSGYSSRFLSTVERGGATSSPESTTKGLRKALSEINCDALLLTGYGSRFNRNALRIAIASRIPIILRAETTDHARTRSSLKAILRDRMLRFAYGRCSILLYIGKRSKEHFRRLGIRSEKLIFSPYCVDDASFQCSEEDRVRMRGPVRQELGIPSGAVALVFSGKLSYRKGAHLLLPALEEFQRKDPMISVIFLGSGECDQLIKEQARNIPHILVRAVGFQNQSRMSRYYNASDLLVLPSVHSETWGLVVNEGLLHGLPSVVSENVGCAPDLVLEGETGEVCQSDSIESLRMAISRGIGLASTPRVRSLCRSHVDAYSVEHAAAGIAEGVRRAIHMDNKGH